MIFLRNSNGFDPNTFLDEQIPIRNDFLSFWTAKNFFMETHDLEEKLDVNRIARLQGKEKTNILQGQERLHHRMRGRMTFLELQIRLVMNTLT